MHAPPSWRTLSLRLNMRSSLPDTLLTTARCVDGHRGSSLQYDLSMTSVDVVPKVWTATGLTRRRFRQTRQRRRTPRSHPLRGRNEASMARLSRRATILSTRSSSKLTSHARALLSITIYTPMSARGSGWSEGESDGLDRKSWGEEASAPSSSKLRSLVLYARLSRSRLCQVANKSTTSAKFWPWQSCQK